MLGIKVVGCTISNYGYIFLFLVKDNYNGVITVKFEKI